MTPGTTGCTEQDSGLQGTVKTVINVLSVVVGIAAVVMIIIAGFRYITSGGKQESVTGAKNTILYAVVGLVIVALAQVIVRFVLTRTTTATQ
ncbi:pilin [Candidatus Saccharibacteria bacterium]|nr:pilin [Candidatus Saccharibacteria bacterium]